MLFKNFFKRGKAKSNASSTPEPAVVSPWIAQNQDTLDELARFIDFAEGFTLGFLEINFTGDLDAVLKALTNQRKFAAASFHTFNFGDPNLRFLKDAMEEQIKQLPPPMSLLMEEKRLITVKGLENAIGMFGDYPPVLQDLNFVRDAWIESVPYPVILCLPSYAINRVIQYAPDFWSWKSGVFRIKSSQEKQDNASIRALHARKSLHSIEELERHERISLLKSLIQDLLPTNDQDAEKEDLRICLEAFLQLADNHRILGDAEQSISIFKKAEEILRNSRWHPETIKDKKLRINYLNKRAFTEISLKNHEDSENHLTMALDLNCDIDQWNRQASLDYLGLLKLKLGLYDDALSLLKRALSMANQSENPYDSYKGVFYTRVGRIYKIKGDFLEAINLFEKGLKINEENNDLYNQAVSLEAIADTQTETNQLVKGLQTYRRATKIWETIGNQPARKRVIKEIENISKTMGFLSSTREDVNSNLETINSEDLGDDRKSV